MKCCPCRKVVRATSFQDQPRNALPFCARLSTAVQPCLGKRSGGRFSTTMITHSYGLLFRPCCGHNWSRAIAEKLVPQSNLHRDNAGDAWLPDVRPSLEHRRGRIDVLVTPRITRYRRHKLPFSRIFRQFLRELVNSSFHNLQSSWTCARLRRKSSIIPESVRLGADHKPMSGRRH